MRLRDGPEHIESSEPSAQISSVKVNVDKRVNDKAAVHSHPEDFDGDHACVNSLGHGGSG